jgi:AbrB family looped-hinge helix DNA binding protein
MRTTIDAAGRVIVPKSIRAAMGLSAGREIDLAYVDGRIEIDLAPVEGAATVEDGWPVFTPQRADLPPLDDRTLRDTVEATRR